MGQQAGVHVVERRRHAPSSSLVQSHHWQTNQPCPAATCPNPRQNSQTHHVRAEREPAETGRWLAGGGWEGHQCALLTTLGHRAHTSSAHAERARIDLTRVGLGCRGLDTLPALVRLSVVGPGAPAACLLCSGAAQATDGAEGCRARSQRIALAHPASSDDLQENQESPAPVQCSLVPKCRQAF